MSIVILLIIIIVIVIFCFNRYNEIQKINYWKTKNVPYVNQNLIIKAFKYLLILRKDPSTIKELYERTPDSKLYGTFFFGVPALIVRDPEFIKCILIKNFNNFLNRFKYDDDYDVLMQNIVIMHGEKWRKTRQQITPIFTSNKLKNMFPLIKEIGNKLKNQIEEKEIDIKNLSSMFTMEVAGSISFGISMSQNPKLFSDFKNTIVILTQLSFISTLRIIIKIIFKNITRILKIRMLSLAMEEFFIYLTKSIIKEKEKSNQKRHDIIDLLMEMKMEKNVEIPENDIILNDEFITAQAFTFFTAGYETTSTSLDFILYELAFNPDIQDKVYNEINDVIISNNNELTYDTLSKMEYITAVINESLRLYPILSVIGRKCTIPFNIPDTNIHIEKDVEIIIPIFGLHRDPKYYPDPNKFLPERFMSNEMNDKHSMVFLPFGAGPRNCIGFRLAYMIIKTGLISILQHYKIEPANDSKYPLEINIPLSFINVKEEMRLKFVKRL